MEQSGVKVRTAIRWLLAIFYAAAGYFHLARPDTFMAVMPGFVPMPEAVIFWTGIAEIAGAIALAQPLSLSLSLRRIAGWALALYAVCVFPANINHFMMDMAREYGGFGLAYHVPRMIAQPVLVWLALWTGGVTDWPFGASRPR